MATNYAETILTAADIIAHSVTNNLSYDKTIVAEITDNGNASHGAYTVASGASTFQAFTDKTDYDVGDSVYVSIPGGDFSKQKMIIGKYIGNTNSSYYNYQSPWKKFIDISGDLVDDNKVESSNKSILANGEDTEKVLWENNEIEAGDGYTCIGLRSGFKTSLSALGAVVGTFGLRLYVSYQTTTTAGGTPQYGCVKFELNNTDMYGDPYDFETYYNQTKLFDISGIGAVIGLKLSLFQDNNFYTSEKEFVSCTGSYSNEKMNNLTHEITKTEYQKLLPDNILIDNIYVALGYNLEDFDGDAVLLYTSDSKTYSGEASNEENQKTLKVRWIHKDSETDEVTCYDKPDDIANIANIHWYKYNLSKGISDKWAGNFWEEIENLEGSFQAIISPNTSVAEESYEVIIESPLYDDLISAAVAAQTEVQSAQSDLNDAKDRFDRISDDFASVPSTTNYNKYVQAKKLYEEAQANFDKITATYITDLQLYTSNILVLKNEQPITSEITADLISGLNIECDTEGYNGIYYLYDQTNQITNAAEATVQRKLVATYNSLKSSSVEASSEDEEDDILNTAESITWRIPKTNTMIQVPTKGIEYTSDDTVTETEDGYYEITRTAAATGTITINGYTGIDIQQIFRIKDYYTSSATNNTVFCVVKKGVYSYTASAELSFGPTGTNGTDYTFILTMDDNKTCLYNSGDYIDPLKIKAQLLDYNNLFVEGLNGSTVTYNWYSRDCVAKVGFCHEDGTLYTAGTDILADSITLEAADGENERCYIRHLTDAEIDKYNKVDSYKAALGLDEMGRDENGRLYTDYANSELDYAWAKKFEKITEWQAWRRCLMGDESNESKEDSTPYYYILHAKINNDNTTSAGVDLGKVVLDAYLPIPYSADVEKYNHIEGSNKIIYDTNGACSYYYKDRYVLYNNNDEEVTAAQWVIKSQASTYDGMPEIDSQGYLSPVSSYVEGLDKRVSIIAKEDIKAEDTTFLWVQPILFYKDVYTSAMLNAWDGSLTIDESNGTIMSTMIGAGYKDSQNRYNGVLIGDVASTGDGYAGTGVYGYSEGEQSFGLNIDGTAFFGKSGHGRIMMDGNSGVIKSSSYDGIDASGMLIDLDDGYIDILGNRIVSKKITTTTDDKGNVTTTVNDIDFETRIKNLIADYTQLKSKAHTAAIDAWKNNGGESVYTEAIAAYNKYSDILEILNAIQDGFVPYDIYNDDLNYYALGEDNKYTIISDEMDENLFNSLTVKTYVPFDNSSYETVNKDFYVQNFIKTKDTISSLSSIFNDTMVTSSTYSEYKTIGSEVKISALNPYFSIISGTENHTELLKIADNDYFLQTDDFVADVLDSDNKIKVAGKGVRLDLQKGSLEAHNFGISSVHNIEDTTDPSSRYNGSSFYLSDNGDPYLRVNYCYNFENTHISNTLMYVGYDQFYLRSANWDEDTNPGGEAKSHGMELDLTKGKLTAYDGFTLISYNNPTDAETDTNILAHKGSYIKISSKGSPFLDLHYKYSESGNVYFVCDPPTVDAKTGSYTINIGSQTDTIENSLLYADYTDFILTSHNFGYAKKVNTDYVVSDNNKFGYIPLGTKLDLSKGEFYAYTFKLTAFEKNLNGLIRIDSTNNDYPLSIFGMGDDENPEETPTDLDKTYSLPVIKSYSYSIGISNSDTSNTKSYKKYDNDSKMSAGTGSFDTVSQTKDVTVTFNHATKTGTRKETFNRNGSALYSKEYNFSMSNNTTSFTEPYYPIVRVRQAALTDEDYNVKTQETYSSKYSGLTVSNSNVVLFTSSEGTTTFQITKNTTLTFGKKSFSFVANKNTVSVTMTKVESTDDSSTTYVHKTTISWDPDNNGNYLKNLKLTVSGDSPKIDVSDIVGILYEEKEVKGKRNTSIYEFYNVPYDQVVRVGPKEVKINGIDITNGDFFGGIKKDILLTTGNPVDGNYSDTLLTEDQLKENNSMLTTKIYKTGLKLINTSGNDASLSDDAYTTFQNLIFYYNTGEFATDKTKIPSNYSSTLTTDVNNFHSNYPIIVFGNSWLATQKIIETTAVAYKPGKKFEVGWDGQVVAENLIAKTGGQIGPFHITEYNLYTSSPSLGGDGIYLSNSGFSVKSGSSGITMESDGDLILTGDIYIGGTIYGENWTLHGSYTSGGGGGGGGGSGSNLGGWKLTKDSMVSSSGNIVLNATEGLTIGKTTLGPESSTFNGPTVFNGDASFNGQVSFQGQFGDALQFINGSLTSQSINASTLACDNFIQHSAGSASFFGKVRFYEEGIFNSTASFSKLATFKNGLSVTAGTNTLSGTSTTISSTDIYLTGTVHAQTKDVYLPVVEKLHIGTKTLGQLAFMDTISLSASVTGATLSKTTTSGDTATYTLTVSGGSVSGQTVYAYIDSDGKAALTTSKPSSYDASKTVGGGTAADTTVTVKVTATATASADTTTT